MILYYVNILVHLYRPAWAGYSTSDPWPPAELDKLPDSARPLFIDRNTRHWDFDGGNKPANMSNEAPGINPDRWEKS